MNPRRAGAVTGRILSSLRRDHRTVAMVLVAPLIIMTLFGFALSGEVVDAPVVVYDADGTNLTKDLIAAWGDARAVQVDKTLNNESARAAVEDREAWVALLIPRGFTQGLQAAAAGGPGAGAAAGSPENLSLLVDATNPQIVSAILDALRDALDEVRPGAATGPLDTERVYGREDARAFDFLIPGLLPFVVFFFATLLTIISLVRERTDGTLARTLTTPSTPGDVVLGYLGAFSILAGVQAGVVLGVALLLFDIELAGSAIELFVVVLLVAFSGLGLGTFLSTAARNELQAIQFIPLVVLPALLLAGVVWPLESMPDWLRPVAYVIPLTYAVRAGRDIMSRGLSISEVPVDLAIIAAFAVLALLLAAIVMRREQAN